MAQRRQKVRGFNLVESAIVLGIVGLVIGGIWAAAAGIQRNMYRNEIIEAVQRANQNFASVWKGLSLSDNAQHYVVITPTIFPPGELVSSAGFSGVNAYYDFGGYDVYKSPSGLLMDVYADTTGGLLSTVVFTFGPIDRADCNWLGRVFLTVAPNNGGVENSGSGQVNVHNSTGDTSLYYYFEFSGFNLGDPMIAALDGACKSSKTNFISIKTGRP